MSDGIRKLLVTGVFSAVIGGVWTLGALKAELDRPSSSEIRVDPAIIQRALLAVEAEPTPQTVAGSPDNATMYFWQAG
jgi:hypothetical protein